METIETWIENESRGVEKLNRPLVTLSYAQSLDGCLTSQRGRPTALSGTEAMRLTHRLRSAHQAILVGIGTVLSDNPRLNVRLVEGVDPQPVVVDTHLRIPLDSFLMSRTDFPPILICSENVDARQSETFQRRGARLISCPVQDDGWIDLRVAIRKIRDLGIRTLMVEGGARVIATMLTKRLADLAVITISPVWLGGLHLTEVMLERSSGWPGLENPVYETMGRDLVVWGKMKESKL
jgi:riboflavin-specific deaminase-like protein